MIMSCFQSGDRKYSVFLYTTLDPSALVTSQKGIDNMGPSSQFSYSVIVLPENGYAKVDDMLSYVLCLVFPRYRFLESTQLGDIHTIYDIL